MRTRIGGAIGRPVWWLMLVLALGALSVGLVACGDDDDDDGGDETPTATATAEPTEDGNGGEETPTSEASPTEEPTEEPTATEEPSGPATVELTAENIAFDMETITVPAGAEVEVTLQNNDAVPHNFAVYTDSTGQEQLFIGGTTNPDQSQTYSFQAPEEPGTYFFRCNIHPDQMTGDFVVE